MKKNLYGGGARPQFIRLLSFLILAAIMLSMMTACRASSHSASTRSSSDSRFVDNGERVIAMANDLSHDELCKLYIGRAEPLSEDEQALYDSTINVLLKEDLWTKRDMCDASEYLMIPMHYAFRVKNQESIQLFADFFERFVKDVTGADIYQFQEASLLSRLQFFYFCTQFMSLCSANGYDALIPSMLPELIQNCAEDYLLNSTANWGTEATVIEHIRQVLAGKTYSRNYYSCIEDFDGFTLSILCDLRYLYSVREMKYDEVLDVAADLAYQLYSSNLLNKETEKGGWLFQVGAWSDYPDYAYAGNEMICEGIQPKVREDISWDSSHFHRMPLFLNSYLSAQPDKQHREIFLLRKKQLANQLVNYVLKNVDGRWLTTTFMDGTNGVYRYEYHEEGVGIEGYGLSGTFLLGWCSLLGDDRITACYEDILALFPMEGNRSNPYYDYTTIREQHPYFDMSTSFDTGMRECIVTCAAKMYAVV